MNKIKKGDNVQVMLGKDRGKTGAVEKLLIKSGKAVIAGVNVYKRHVKKQGEMEGGVVELSKPVNLSNLSLVCPNCKKITRAGFKLEGTEKLRVCKKCGKEIK